MAWRALEEKKGKLTEVRIFNTYNEEKKRLAFVIDKERKRIEFYPTKPYFLDKIILDGFSKIPKEFLINRGKIKSGMQYYFEKMFSNKKVTEIRISKVENNRFRKYNGKYKVTLAYTYFKLLIDKLSSISTDAKIDRSHSVNEIFTECFPKKFNKLESNPKRKVSKIMYNLDESIIPILEKDEIEKIQRFVESLLKIRYQTGLSRWKLFSTTKVKVDEVALDDIIVEFEKLLKKKHSEKTWGDFLQRNIFLIDSRYVDYLREINVALGTQRKADFGLIDYEGCLAGC